MNFYTTSKYMPCLDLVLALCTLETKVNVITNLFWFLVHYPFLKEKFSTILC